MQMSANLSRQEFGIRAGFLKLTNAKQLPENEAIDMVYLIDHDGRFREELMKLLGSLGLEATGFESAREYHRHPRRDRAACLIADFHVPDVHGLELLRQVKEQSGPPVIFVSGSPDVSDTVSAMRAGAMEFFEKPVDLDSLQAAIRLAIAQDRRVRQREVELAKLKARLSLLTPREREVLPLVVGGLLNKRAAAVLGISEVTLQIHRSQVMRKMAADSVADLVRMAVKLRIPYRGEGHFTQANAGQDQLRGSQHWGPRLVTS